MWGNVKSGVVWGVWGGWMWVLFVEISRSARVQREKTNV